MGNGIRPTNTSFTTFMKFISQAFVLDGTCKEEIIACIINLKTLHLKELMAYQLSS